MLTKWVDRMADKTVFKNGDMLEALRYGLRDPNEGHVIDRTLMEFVFDGDEHSVDMARELLLELLTHYKKGLTQ